jgi:hypothetical protein
MQVHQGENIQCWRLQPKVVSELVLETRLNCFTEFSESQKEESGTVMMSANSDSNK